MDIGEFQAIINKKGIDKLAGIIFDNSIRWYFDDKRKVPNTDPATKDKQPFILEAVPINECFKIETDISCLSRKVYFPGKSPYDEDNKAYYWDVVHVENIQKLIFADDKNVDYLRMNFDLSLT